MPPESILAKIALPFPAEIVLLLAFSGLIAYLSLRIRIAPIVGYLIAGALVGPYAFAVVDDMELVQSLAEIGVLLLLFTIGVGFSLKKLKAIGWFIAKGGVAQVTGTTLATATILWFFDIPTPICIYTGCLVALSSTALILGVLGDRAETDTPAGQLSLGILIFQDLAVLGMVLLVPTLGGQGGGILDVVLTLSKAMAILVMVVVLARLVVPRILSWVAKTRHPELFLLTVVAICFGTAWLTSLFDVSPALGAFLAGMIVSESHYSEQALSEMIPLRTLFTAVFFVSVGMLFDIGFVIQHPLLTIGIALSVLLLKFLVTSGSVLLAGYPVRAAAIVGMYLAQIGEFSFVLQLSGQAFGLSPMGLGDIGDHGFLAVAVLSMVVTPFLMRAGPAIGIWLAELLPFRRGDHVRNGAGRTLRDHVIVVGYGPAGRRLVTVLSSNRIPHVILEFNPHTVEESMKAGAPIFYGDASRLPILELANIREARVLVVAINDADAATRIVRVAKHENPALQIFVRTRFIGGVEILRQAGADVIVPEELETAIRLFANVLNAYMIPPERITEEVRSIREDDYGILRGSIQEAHMMVLQGLDEEGLHTRAVVVKEDAPAAGKTLADLNLRSAYGLSVLVSRRKDRTIGNPSGSYRIESGDRLVLIGHPTRFARAAHLFTCPSGT